MTRAFAYLRVSHHTQIDGDGFPRQLAAIQNYASANDTRVVKIFREEGVSGTVESMDRPAWSALVTALHSTGVRTILIERLDRLARDLLIQETVIADLQKSGFTLISTAEPDLMANDPSRILIRQILGALAQHDKSQIVLKLRAARTRLRAKLGRCEGRKPFGYRDGEQAILERMKALHAASIPYLHISTILNTEGLKPRQGERWYPATVRRILLTK